MNKEIKPREYQKECLAAIDEAIAKGEKRALVVMASGLGKTYTAAFAIERFFAERHFGRVLILCHSEKILCQTKEKFRGYFGEEFSYGMYIDTDKTSHSTDFLFATFQTLKNYRKDFPKDEFAYIVVDEAHHSHARTYFPTIRYFEPQFLLGLTATPDRLDGQKIEEIYGKPIYELDFVEATKRSLLADCDYRLVLDDLSQEKLNEYLKSDEKISINQLNRTLFIEKRDEEIIKLIGEYSAEVEDPKMMIFCRTIKHARKIARLMGKDVALVHNSQSDSVNDYALEAFKSGEIRTIISVDMLNEGVDIPDANIVVFLRNTVSPAVFYQQLGRGTRLAGGKERVLVLDFVNNCERIKTIFELKNAIDDFQAYTPHEDEGSHGDGNADKKEYFALNIATIEFQARKVDIAKLLERSKRWHNPTRDELIQCVNEKYAELGRTPRATDIINDGRMPSYHFFLDEFGSWSNTLLAAGLDDYLWDKEEIIKILQRKSVNGTLLTLDEMNGDDELPCAATIIRLFESTQNLATLCGLKLPLSRKRKTRTNLTYDEMIYDYYLFALQLGHWPSVQEMKDNQEIPSAEAYRNVCGCGVKELPAIVSQKYQCSQIEEYIPYKWTKDVVMERFARLINEKKCKPTEQDVNACEYLPKAGTCRAIVGCGLAQMYHLCNGDEVVGGGKKSQKVKKPLDDDTIRKLKNFVQKHRRKILAADLASENGLPSKTSIQQNKGWSMAELNELIGADAILAELQTTN